MEADSSLSQTSASIADGPIEQQTSSETSIESATEAVTPSEEKPVGETLQEREAEASLLEDSMKSKPEEDKLISETSAATSASETKNDVDYMEPDSSSRSEAKVEITVSDRKGHEVSKIEEPLDAAQQKGKIQQSRNSKKLIENWYEIEPLPSSKKNAGASGHSASMEKTAPLILKLKKSDPSSTVNKLAKSHEIDSTEPDSEKNNDMSLIEPKITETHKESLGDKKTDDSDKKFSPESGIEESKEQSLQEPMVGGKPQKFSSGSESDGGQNRVETLQDKMTEEILDLSITKSKLGESQEKPSVSPEIQKIQSTSHIDCETAGGIKLIVGKSDRTESKDKFSGDSDKATPQIEEKTEEEMEVDIQGSGLQKSKADSGEQHQVMNDHVHDEPMEVDPSSVVASSVLHEGKETLVPEDEKSLADKKNEAEITSDGNANTTEETENKQGMDKNKQGMDKNKQEMDKNKQGMDKNKQEMDKNKQGIDESKQEMDKNKQGMDKSKQEMDKNKQGMNESKQEMDENKQEMDENKQGMDENKQGMDKNKQGMDKNKQGMDKNKQEMDENTQEMDEKKQGMEKNKQRMNKKKQGIDENKQRMNESKQGIDENKQGMDENKQGMDEGVLPSHVSSSDNDALTDEHTTESKDMPSDNSIMEKKVTEADKMDKTIDKDRHKNEPQNVSSPSKMDIKEMRDDLCDKDTDESSEKRFSAMEENIDLRLVSSDETDNSKELLTVPESSLRKSTSDGEINPEVTTSDKQTSQKESVDGIQETCAGQDTPLEVGAVTDKDCTKEVVDDQDVNQDEKMIQEDCQTKLNEEQGEKVQPDQKDGNATCQRDLLKEETAVDQTNNGVDGTEGTKIKEGRKEEDSSESQGNVERDVVEESMEAVKEKDGETSAEKEDENAEVNEKKVETEKQENEEKQEVDEKKEEGDSADEEASSKKKQKEEETIQKSTSKQTDNTYGFPVENVFEYQWPQETGAEYFFVQEQISEFLGIKSFKRKYPELERRMLDIEERKFLKERGVVTEEQVTLGLNALKSEEVYDLMMKDYPDRYAEYARLMQEKQRQSIKNRHQEYGKAAVDATKMKNYIKKAMKQAADYNATLMRERREERQYYLDLQTMLVHQPTNRMKKLKKEKTNPGSYPVAVIPGQFQNYYKTYTSPELKYLPINTALYGPMATQRQTDIGPNMSLQEEQSEEEDDFVMHRENIEVQQETAKTKDTTSSLPPNIPIPQIPSLLEPELMEQDLPRVATPQMAALLDTPMEPEKVATPPAPPVYKPKVIPDAICGLCLNDKLKNRKGDPEELVHCSQCDNSGHPSCLEMSADLVLAIKTYPWQCMECKTCTLCGDPTHEDKMMFCDECDRGYHTFCVGLQELPTGQWSCPRCRSSVDPPLNPAEVNTSSALTTTNGTSQEIPVPNLPPSGQSTPVKRGQSPVTPGTDGAKPPPAKKKRGRKKEIKTAEQQT